MGKGGLAKENLLGKFIGNNGDFFGHSVSISGDAALIGAYGDDLNEGPSLPSHQDAGSSYVFVRSNGVWTEQAKLIPSNDNVPGHGNNGDYFSS